MQLDRTFVCGVCGGEFIKGWTDAEALAEYADNWSQLPPADFNDKALVCDDCYAKVMAWVAGRD
jgi:hypothetical protein